MSSLLKRRNEGVNMIEDVNDVRKWAVTRKCAIHTLYPSYEGSLIDSIIETVKA
jgi:hypothetical protein